MQNPDPQETTKAPVRQLSPLGTLLLGMGLLPYSEKSLEHRHNLRQLPTSPARLRARRKRERQNRRNGRRSK